MDQASILNKYRETCESNETALVSLRKRQLIVSLLRLVVFIGGGILTGVLFTNSVFGGITGVILTVIFFLFLLKRFAEYSDRIKFTENLVRINRNEISGLNGDFSEFGDGLIYSNPQHDFSSDIDLFGESSLFRYLNRTVTSHGETKLAEWLSEPCLLMNDIIARQEAVKELSGKFTWRQNFMAAAPEMPPGKDELHSLIRWLNEGEKFFSAGLLKVAAFFLPAAGLSAIILASAGIVPINLFVTIFVFNLILIGAFLKKTNRIHQAVSVEHNFLSSLGLQIKSFRDETFTSSILGKIKEKMCSENGSAEEEILKLNNILRAFDSRLNLFVGFILNGLLLWDFHCLIILEKWRRSAAACMPQWLDNLGEVDALNSFANFAFNNPDYVFPDICSGEPVIEAVNIGHPLLKREVRIGNDFSIQKKGCVVVVTGANMSGKSTFLRTLAVNLVLGMTGAPVCAEKLRFSTVNLFTSMRTTDSLSNNESYFYAELKRLKVLKERLENGKNMFFILDEILKGTNSTDKSLGSKLFMRRLITLGGTGIIATHDISLGEMEKEFPGNVVNKCFEIDIDGEKINFDYKLRDGMTTKMNASLLMKQMGIA